MKKHKETKILEFDILHIVILNYFVFIQKRRLKSNV